MSLLQWETILLEALVHYYDKRPTIPNIDNDTNSPKPCWLFCEAHNSGHVHHIAMPYQIACAALEQQIVFDKNVFTNKTGRKIDMAIIVKDGIQSVNIAYWNL